MSMGTSVGGPQGLSFVPPLIMGILNVTPDSFSDGGLYQSVGPAVRRAVDMVEYGATIVDIGGESTRPGAIPVDSKDERLRIMPVVRAVVKLGIPVSVDALHADTAYAAIDAGAAYTNDVSGGLFDPLMASVIAGSLVTYISSHWGGGASGTPPHSEIRSTVAGDLARRRHALQAQGVPATRIILDPGSRSRIRQEQSTKLAAAGPSVRPWGARTAVSGGALTETFHWRAISGRYPSLGERYPVSINWLS